MQAVQAVSKCLVRLVLIKCFLSPRSQIVDEVIHSSSSHYQHGLAHLYQANPLIHRLRTQDNEGERTEKWMEDHFGKKEVSREAVNEEKASKTKEFNNIPHNTGIECSDALISLIVNECNKKEEMILAKVEEYLEKRIKMKMKETMVARDVPIRRHCDCLDGDKDAKLDNLISRSKLD